MKKYLFTTETTMTESNSREWWIDRDIIQNMYISANSLKEATAKYISAARDTVDISKTAASRPEIMYIDSANGSTEKIGYVFKAKYLFERNSGECVEKYILLWVTVYELQNPFSE